MKKGFCKGFARSKVLMEAVVKSLKVVLGTGTSGWLCCQRCTYKAKVRGSVPVVLASVHNQVMVGVIGNSTEVFRMNCSGKDTLPGFTEGLMVVYVYILRFYL